MKSEVSQTMNIVYMLLHDFRFAGWTLETFLKRFHFAKAYAKYLGERGHDVSLIAFHQDIKEPKVFDKGSYLLYILPSNLLFPPLLKFGNEHSTYLLQYIRDVGRGADVVHIHGYWLWSSPYVILLIKQYVKEAKIVVQYHGETDRSKTVRALLFRKIYSYPDLFLVARESEIAFLKKYLLKGQLAEKIVKFPNVGANDDIFRPVKNKSERPSVVYTGRIMHERRNKFPFLLLRLAKERALRDVTFYIIGDGPLLKFFQKYVHKHHLTNVYLTGYIPVFDVAKFMSSSWLYFYPGFLERADGYWDGAVKEALLCGTPTVALNFDMKQEDITEDSMGFLLPSNSLDAITRGLKILINERREIVLQKSKEVLKNAQLFSWKNIISNLEKIYKSIY